MEFNDLWFLKMIIRINFYTNYGKSSFLFENLYNGGTFQVREKMSACIQVKKQKEVRF